MPVPAICHSPADCSGAGTSNEERHIADTRISPVQTFMSKIEAYTGKAPADFCCLLVHTDYYGLGMPSDSEHIAGTDILPVRTSIVGVDFYGDSYVTSIEACTGNMSAPAVCPELLGCQANSSLGVGISSKSWWALCRCKLLFRTHCRCRLLLPISTHHGLRFTIEVASLSISDAFLDQSDFPGQFMQVSCFIRSIPIRAGAFRLRQQHITRQSGQRCLSSQLPSKSIVFSGIQPTGVPHIGNWVGALRQWVDLQDGDAHLLYSIVDLHAITVPQDASSLRQWRREALAVLLAIGVDPARSTVFFQSRVPAHAELMWILACQSPLGRLSRMTTWKSKTQNDDMPTNGRSSNSGFHKLGLFAYPILQAADILVHRAQFVPVGSDQTQHLEFARECARNFNKACGVSVLQEPTALYSTTPRIMSLRDPLRKMSKSDKDSRSRIMLTDSPDEIRLKVRASVTDSLEGITYRSIDRPGISNLIDILACLERRGPDAATLAKSLQGYTIQGLKELLADRLIKRIEPIRETYRALVETNSGLLKLEEIAESGQEMAAKNARETMSSVYRAMGLT